MLIQLVAIIAIILYVAQVQVDVLTAPPSNAKIAKIVLLIAAAILILIRVF